MSKHVLAGPFSPSNLPLQVSGSVRPSNTCIRLTYRYGLMLAQGIMYGSLGQPKFISQTAPVQPFLHSSRQRVYTLQWAAPSPLKLPLSHGELNSHLTHGSWAHPSPHPKRHLGRFSRFCRAQDRDRPTDRPRYSVNSNQPHLRCMQCGLIMMFIVIFHHAKSDRGMS